MLNLLREALNIWIIKARIDALNQAFYAAVSYAHEVKARNEEGEFDDLALDYVSIVLPKINRDEARKHLLAMQSRLNGVGAKPELKI